MLGDFLDYSFFPQTTFELAQVFRHHQPPKGSQIFNCKLILGRYI